MIVAIAGNAVENVVGGQLAAQGQVRPRDLGRQELRRADRRASCSPCSCWSRCCFDDQLTFVLDPVYIGALALTAIAVWQITGDGEAVLFEGLALVALYVVLATLVWFE